MDKNIDCNDKQEQEDAVIKALKEEYESIIAEERRKHAEELENKLKEQEEKHIRQMRALLSGRAENVPATETKTEKSFEEDLEERLKKRFNL